MQNAAAQRLYVPESANVARAFLSELTGAHRALLSEMANMDFLTREAQPDQVSLMAGRWKVSQASLARRMLASRIHQYFLDRCNPAEAEELATLQKLDQALLRGSAGHVSQWRADCILADWRGYCDASREIRKHMQEVITLEQRVLYPLLERSANRF